ncbi:tryptophan--tRNA ligase [Buchnera aphidicola]|uniref:tryptophan--tRNA ligase n=1 Tax=Buchnera aphidicola TaxID=9 RepID=UPI003464DFA0
MLFSAVQPSGLLTIANYLGVLCHWKEMQDSYDCIYCIADLHAMTAKKKIYKKKNKNENIKTILDTLALYLACGVDPNESIVFLQSQVLEHTQLNWILNCYTNLGELFRMTQFKVKSKNENASINSGLLTYPILMASDILLYDVDKVLVGEDQKQHIELTKKIARRVNGIYSKEIFTIPSVVITKSGSRIKSLLDPTKKMSKSDFNRNSSIFMLDNIELINKKFAKAVTDSENPANISFNKQKKPGVSNLLEILSALKNIPIIELEKFFLNKTYLDLKLMICQTVKNKLLPIQEKYFLYRKDEEYLKDILFRGATKAKKRAKETIKRLFSVLN